MCAVSMVGDHYAEKWRQHPLTLPATNVPGWFGGPVVPQGPTKEEFDALRKDVLEMKELLKRAKIYDEQTGQKDCEMADKVAVLRKVAELVGVGLDEIFPNS